jgi:hypothetical protein
MDNPFIVRRRALSYRRLRTIVDEHTAAQVELLVDFLIDTTPEEMADPIIHMAVVDLFLLAGQQVTGLVTAIYRDLW